MPKANQTVDERLIDVLGVLNVSRPSQTFKIVKENDVLTRHLLQLEEVIVSYREKGHFHHPDKGHQSEGGRKREAREAQALFGIFNKAAESKTREADLVFHNKKKNAGSYSLDLIALGLNITALILSSIAASHVDVGLPVEGMNSANPISWGYVNALGGIVQGIIEIKLGNYTTGSALLLSGAELVAATVLTHLGHTAGFLAATSAGGIMAGSFAFCMFTAFCLEKNQARMAGNRVSLLEAELLSVKAGDREDKDVKIEHLEYAILFEKAKRQNHLREATAWKYATLVMMSASVVAVLALGTLSLGAIPAISAAISVLAMLTTLIRRHWVNKVDHVSYVEKARGENFIAKLDALDKVTMTFDDKATMKLSTEVSVGWGPFKKKTTIGQYLKEMLYRDHVKAKALITAFEGGHGGPFLDELPPDALIF